MVKIIRFIVTLLTQGKKNSKYDSIQTISFRQDTQ